jgi:hypothetical protein
MKKRTALITHEALKKAIATYLADGGRIQKLPAQKTVSTTLVGRRWSNTEIDSDRLN